MSVPRYGECDSCGIVGPLGMVSVPLGDGRTEVWAECAECAARAWLAIEAGAYAAAWADLVTVLA